MRYSRIFLLIISVFLVFLVTCSRSENKIQFILTENEICPIFDRGKMDNTYDFKLIIYVKDSQCAFCLAKLKTWDSAFQKDFNLYDNQIKYYYIFNKNCDTVQLEFLLEKMNLCNNTYYDVENVIERKYVSNKLKNAVFINNKNRVIYNFSIDYNYIQKDIKILKRFLNHYTKV